MRKIIAFSDIDGTIIVKVSNKQMKKYNEKNKDNPLIKVSTTQYGSSYMRTYDNKLLREIDSKISFVLITSRGQESYNKINLGFIPTNVLVEGGSVLLINGIVDEEWNMEIMDIIKEEKEWFEVIREKVYNLGYQKKNEKNKYLLDFIDADYIKSENKEKKNAKFEMTKKSLFEEKVIKEKFNIYPSSNGMFIVHKKLEKGEMIKKYIRKFKNNPDFITVSIGDTQTDSTMFDITKYSFGSRGSGATNEYEILDTLDSKIGFTSFALTGLNQLINM